MYLSHVRSSLMSGFEPVGHLAFVPQDTHCTNNSSDICQPC